MNIIEKVKELHKIISDASEKEQEYITFRTPIHQDRVKQYLKAGKWSSLHLEAHPDTFGTTEIQIVPWLESLKWPVSQTLGYMESAIEAPTIKDYFLCVDVDIINQSRTSCVEYKENWKTFKNIVLPMYQLFGGTEANFAYFEELVFNEQNWPDNDEISEEEYFERSLKSALYFDNSNEHTLLLDLVKQYQDDSFLPEVPVIDLGIYEPQILSSISARAYARGFNEPFEKLERQLMLAASYAHGFGTEDSDLRIQPSRMETALQVFYPIEFLFEPFNVEKISNEVKSMPEFHIAQSMNEKKRGYNGIAHMEVAALMDEKYNDPKKAWKYLQAASYWVGKNMPEAQSTVLDAGIHLCDKNGWKEALEVLEHNKQLMMK